MRIRSSVDHWVIAPFVVALCGLAAAQELAKQTLQDMETADGLEATLFAHEPDLYNPTTIDVDAQGRVWVCEAVNYRLFNQPKTREEGDRIQVLEDTDGDGVCDKSTTFYQDPTLQAPMGIAVLGNRVYICQSPDLFYLEDTDGDGVADKREVILTGFKGIDHDHAIHGVMFGPDGHLYVSNGDRGLDVTDKVGNRINVGQDGDYKAATVLRTDLDGNRLELLAEGLRNPYEPAVDCYGNVFISDNDDDGNESVRIDYIMEGGNYGYWPRRKGNRKLDAVHWNEDQPGVVPKMVRTGFGSPTGMLFYEGDLLPERYRYTLIHADAGPGVIRSYPFEPDGAGYRSEIVTVLSCPEDEWFRPSDVCVAPDGSIFVADWYDPGVGGHRMGDIENGRIYRLAPKGAAYTVPPLDLKSADGVTNAFTSPNQARRYLGYNSLERAANSGDTAVLEWLWKNGEPAARARALWLLGPTNRDVLLAASKDGSNELRTEAIRIFALLDGEGLDKADWLVNDPAPQVRRQLLLTLGNLERADWSDEWLLRLASHYDGEDRFYREAIGIAFRGRESWAYAALSERLGGTWDARMAGLSVQLHPNEALPFADAAVNDVALALDLRKRAMDAIDAVGTADGGKAIVACLTSGSPREMQLHALHLLSRDEGDVWRAIAEGDPVDAYLRDALADEQMKDVAKEFIRETRRTAFIPVFIETAQDTAEMADARVSALETVRLLAAHDNGAVNDVAMTALATLVKEDAEPIQVAAISAISAVRNNAAMDVLKDTLLNAELPKAVRRESVRILSGTKSGSVLMLTLAEQGDLPMDIRLDVQERTHASNDEDIRLMAEQILPRDMTAEGKALPPIAELLAISGDAAHGHDAFFSETKAQCYRCHLVQGEGREVGPDLSKIGEKLSKEGILESILNPSAAVSHEYVVWVVKTWDDGYLSGYIRAENDEEIELMDSGGNAIKIAKTDILERRKTNVSLMPTGLSAGMTAGDLADIVAYLSKLR